MGKTQKNIVIVDVNSLWLAYAHNKTRKMKSSKNDRQIDVNALYFSEHFFAPNLHW